VWPVVLVAFVVIFVEPFGVLVSGIVGAVLLLAAFGFVGVKLLGMSDEEWERGVGQGAQPPGTAAGAPA